MILYLAHSIEEFGVQKRPNSRRLIIFLSVGALLVLLLLVLMPQANLRFDCEAAKANTKIDVYDLRIHDSAIDITVNFTSIQEERTLEIDEYRFVAANETNQPWKTMKRIFVATNDSLTFAYNMTRFDRVPSSVLELRGKYPEDCVYIFSTRVNGA